MKLRIRGNSLRFRLTQTEIADLANGIEVEETTDFGNGETFVYSIFPVEIEQIKATFYNGKIQISVPLDSAKNLAESDEVGISSNQNSLKILIEKDFTCLQPRGEEDKDTFPHPKVNDLKC